MKHMVGLWLLVMLSGAVRTARAAGDGSSIPATQPAASENAVVVTLQGVIDDYQRDALVRRFNNARKLGAAVVIVQIDTYGGEVKAGLEISHFLKNQKGLRVIAYVPEKAISAGAMIALACDQIVMGPGAKLGDAAPISVRNGTLEPLPAAERAKVESPVLEDFRDSARRNGYDELLAESMVVVGREVHWIQNDKGERRFVGAQEYQRLTADGAWKAVPDVRDPVDAADELLTVYTDKALKLGLAKAQAASVDELAATYGYHIVATLRPSAGDRVVEWLASAPIRFILLVVFLISLYTALHVPGHGAPEAIAVVSLAALIGLPLLTGYAQWWEIIVILSGLALLAFEVFVFPGHMVSGIIGLVMAIGGLLMTFVPKEPSGLPGILPTFGATWSALQQGLLVVVGGLACSLFLWFWLNRYLPKMPYFNRLILTQAVGGGAAGEGAAAAPTAAGDFPMIGAVGQAVTDLRPGGTAAFLDDATGDNRMVDVVSESGFIPADGKIVVRENRGSYVVVRTIGEAST